MDFCGRNVFQDYFSYDVHNFFFLKLQLQQPNLRGLCLAQYCIFFFFSCRSPELYQQNLCQILYVCYELFWENSGYGFFLVIPKL